MIKICKERWALKEKDLREKFSSMTAKEITDLEYSTLVAITMDIVLNCDELKLDIENIHEIDDGNYQGTLLYLIPFKTYQPLEDEYLMTNVSYGSCSGCDTLLGITGYCVKNVTEEMINQLVALCKDLIMCTINPYDDSGKFEVVKFDE